MASAQTRRPKAANDSNPLPGTEDEAGESKPYSGPDSTGASLLALLETLPRWAGDDLEECLEGVYASRSQMSFETWWEEDEDMTPTTPSKSKRRELDKIPQRSPADASGEDAAGKKRHPAGVPATTLLAHFGRWHGDDLDELIEEVYRTRSKVRF